MGEGRDFCGRKVKTMEPGGNMLEKKLESFPQAQKSEGAQGLHEALCRSLPEIISEAGLIKISFRQPIRIRIERIIPGTYY